MDNNYDVKFWNQSSKVVFYQDKTTILEGYRKHGCSYFLIDLKPTIEVGAQIDVALYSAKLKDSLKEWHKRLGHCSMETVQTMLKSDAINGMKVNTKDKPECQTCIESKICKTHHPQRRQKLASPTAAVLHIDTVGPIHNVSLGGSKYFILATEEYSGYKYFETMESKISISDSVKRIIHKAELESNRPVKAILTDNGSEYANENLARWLNIRGIIHNYSTSYTPQQNGLAERNNRTVINGIRTLLHDSKLPKTLWAEALNTFIYANNRTLSSKDPNKTPYELLRNQKPNISNLKVFGQNNV